MRAALAVLSSLLLFGCATPVPGLIGASELKLGTELRAQVSEIARRAEPVQPLSTEATLHHRARGNFGAVLLYEQTAAAQRTSDGLKEEVRSSARKGNPASLGYERTLSLCGLVDLLSESSSTPPPSEIVAVRGASSTVPVVASGGLPTSSRFLTLTLEIDHPSPCNPEVGDKMNIARTGQLLRRVIGPIGTLQRLQDVDERASCVVSSGADLRLPSAPDGDLLLVSCTYKSSIGSPIAGTFAFIRSARQYVPLLDVRAEGTDTRYEYKSIR